MGELGELDCGVKAAKGRVGAMSAEPAGSNGTMSGVFSRGRGTEAVSLKQKFLVSGASNSSSFCQNIVGLQKVGWKNFKHKV